MILTLLVAMCDEGSQASGCYHHFTLKVTTELSNSVLCTSRPEAGTTCRNDDGSTAVRNIKRRVWRERTLTEMAAAAAAANERGMFTLFITLTHDVFSRERSSEAHMQSKAVFLGNVITFLLSGRKDLALSIEKLKSVFRRRHGLIVIDIGVVVLSRNLKKKDILTAIPNFIKDLNEILLY